MKKPGKVYLVGAGPGDPGLLTVKGADRLKSCDLLIYDALISQEVLDLAGPKALKIYVGKAHAGRSVGASGEKRAFEQDEINRLMVHYAKEGKTVVRLKGGDPFLFGRGGEEAEFLVDHRVPFEVVPGVSALSSVPAYAGIPVTDRRHNSMLTVVTGHASEDVREGPGVDWKKISPKGTLVIFMGVDRFKTIVQNLLRQGWPGNTPVACIRWGTTPNQKVLIGTLLGIIRKMESARPAFASPAIIVIGSVVDLRKKLDWFRPSPSKKSRKK